MRTYTSNNITITYQDPIVWLGDSNIVTLESSTATDKVGAEIIVRHPAGLESRTIRHLSELPRLMFVLDDALLALDDDNIGQYTVQVNVFIDNVQTFTKSYTFQLLKGKSFTNQSHGISRTIYVYDQTELLKLGVYAPQSGTFHINNTYLTLARGLNNFNLSSYITEIGEYSFCLENAQVPPSAVITGDVVKTPTISTLQFATVCSAAASSSEEKGGDVFRYDETIFPVCYDIIYEEPCWDENFVELQYIDSDGCIRYLGGKIAEESNKVTGSGYERADGTNVFRNIPRRHIDATQRTIKVGFTDIAKDAYPQDILYSDTIWMRMYNGEWWSVVLASDTITVKNENFLDFELNIIISRE